MCLSVKSFGGGFGRKKNLQTSGSMWHIKAREGEKRNTSDEMGGTHNDRISTNRRIQMFLGCVHCKMYNISKDEKCNSSEKSITAPKL